MKNKTQVTAKDYLEICNSAIGKSVALCFFYFLSGIGLGLALDFDNTLGDKVFKTAYTALAIALLSFALAHLWFGIIKQFGFESIIKVAVSLFIGSLAINAVTKDSNYLFYLTTGSGIYLTTFLITSGWNIFKIAKKRNQPLPREVSGDPSVRGQASIFQTGSHSYRLVKRHNLQVTSAAKDFEYRLIRHIEKKLGVKAYSISGDGCDYWKLEGLPAEIIVLGPNRYNTRIKIEKAEWILRIRETEPTLVTDWLAEHFAQDHRKTKSAFNSIQTQLSSNDAGDVNALLKQNIPFPLPKPESPKADITKAVLH